MVYKHKKSLKLIAHNAGYDFRFLLKHLYSVDTIEKSNSIMSCNALAYNGEYVLSLKISCSLKMINMPLRKFGKCFNLDVKKEIMPYSLYTEENVKINNLDINYCLSFVDKKDKDEYLENCRRWGCIKDDKIDILRYAGEYCYMDCITLIPSSVRTEAQGKLYSFLIFVIFIFIKYPSYLSGSKFLITFGRPCKNPSILFIALG